MSTKAVGQVDVVDVTDAYSIILTSEAHTFPGTTSAAKAGSTTTQVIAMQGGTQVAASVTLSEVTAPTGVTVTKDTDATAPTLTIAVSTAVTSAGTVTIPVHIGSDVTIDKTFSFAIAFTGGTGKGISSTTVEYQAASSGTTVPTGTWSTSIPSVAESQYLWTRTTIAYTSGDPSVSYSVGKMGAKGDTGSAGKGIASTTVTYQASSSGTTVPTGTWSSSVPAVSKGQYLWTKTVTTYTSGDPTTSYSVGYAGTNGTNGTNGADALTLVVTSSNGTIFKNSSIATTLTAHVYKGGVEVTGTALTAIGTIKWYKDGSTTAAATGQTLTIDAGDVTGKATYVAQLEG